MLLYVSKEFTAAAAGSTLKEVTCEHCGKQFYYELSRIGVGTASAPYMLGQKAAKNTSQQRAAGDLQKHLMRDEETVPCPQCQWINTSAILAYRKTRQRGWTTLVILAAALGIVVNLVTFGMSRDVLGRDRSLSDSVHWCIAAAWLSIAGLCLLAQWLLRRRIDPNRTCNGKKRLPAGTPPALVPIGEDANGDLKYEVIPYDPALIEQFSKWAMFRAGKLPELALCCRCLGAPETTLKLPFVAQQQPMPVPICHRCRRAILKQWWLANLASLLLAFGVAWLAAQWPKGIDNFGRNMMTVFLGLLFTGIGFATIDQVIRPFRFAAVDPQRGVSKIRFRNPAYTALLIRHIGEADGYFKSGGTKS